MPHPPEKITKYQVIMIIFLVLIVIFNLYYWYRLLYALKLGLWEDYMHLFFEQPYLFNPWSPFTLFLLMWFLVGPFLVACGLFLLFDYIVSLIYDPNKRRNIIKSFKSSDRIFKFVNMRWLDTLFFLSFIGGIIFTLFRTLLIVFSY